MLISMASAFNSPKRNQLGAQTRQDPLPHIAARLGLILSPTREPSVTGVAGVSVVVRKAEKRAGWITNGSEAARPSYGVHLDFDAMPRTLELRFRHQAEDVEVQVMRNGVSVLTLVASFAIIARSDADYELWVGPQEIE